MEKEKMQVTISCLTAAEVAALKRAAKAAGRSRPNHIAMLIRKSLSGRGKEK